MTVDVLKKLELENYNFLVDLTTKTIFESVGWRNKGSLVNYS